MARRASKVFAGSRIRELRGRIGQTQQALAHTLKLSASYLNQIENDQRPIPPPLLLKLCNLFDVSAAYFGDNDEIRQIQTLREIFGDPLFKSATLRPTELQTAVRASPGLTDRFITLYRAFRAHSEQTPPGAMSSSSTLRNQQDSPLFPLPTTSSVVAAGHHLRPLTDAGEPERSTPPPYEEVGDWVQKEKNYFDEIDRAGEDFYEKNGFQDGIMAANLSRYLRDRHDLRIITDPDLDSRGIVWRLDRRGKRLLIADGVPSESSVFLMAQVIGRLDFSRVMDRAIRRAALTTADARSLARVGMSNYFAGSLLLPYNRFRQSARKRRHDLDQLQRQFGVSFEQVCHRLSTLQRPGAEGIPFYFIKTDIAGNILKSYSATRFSLTRFGGLCSQWNVFRSFCAPGQLHVQVSRTTDDAVFLNVARTVGHAGVSYFDRQRLVAVVLGCSIAHAPEIVYSAGLNLDDERMVVPVGPGCRACIRTDCRHRAMPAAGLPIDAGGDERGVVPYRIARGGE